MKTLVFATNNEHKLREVRAMMPPEIEVLGLSDLKCSDELPETSSSLEGNAMQKARYVKMKLGYDCFADDTGLEVDALCGEPGVYSARYAGPECDNIANIRKLLGNLSGKSNRNARFRTVIALIHAGYEWLRVRFRIRPRRVQTNLCRAGRGCQKRNQSSCACRT